MKNSNLPMGFEKLRPPSAYVNLGKLPEGEFKFRIVGRPIAGWLDWKDKKPYRFRPDEKPASSFDPDKPIKSFWAMHVWDYTKGDLCIMEVTQNSIKKALEEYAMSEDWGDLTSYDIKIKKEGSGIETKYSVMPVPHKALPKDIQEAVKGSKIRLEALYEGKDPWTDLEGPVGASDELSEDQCAWLDSLIDQLEDPSIKGFICKRAAIESIYDLPQEKFDGVIEYLEKQIAIKNKGAKAS